MMSFYHRSEIYSIGQRIIILQIKSLYMVGMKDVNSGVTLMLCRTNAYKAKTDITYPEGYFL